MTGITDAKGDRMMRDLISEFFGVALGALIRDRLHESALGKIRIALGSAPRRPFFMTGCATGNIQGPTFCLILVATEAGLLMNARFCRHPGIVGHVLRTPGVRVRIHGREIHLCLLRGVPRLGAGNTKQGITHQKTNQKKAFGHPNAGFSTPGSSVKGRASKVDLKVNVQLHC